MAVDFRDESFPILKEYLTYQGTVRQKSKKTVSEYFLDLRMFFRYLKLYYKIVPKDTEFEEIDIKDIDIDFLKRITLNDAYEFMSYLYNDRELNASSRARKCSSLKGFFKYITKKKHYLSSDPVEELELPKKKKALPKYLTLEQSIELLNAVEGAYKERDYAIITLFLNCGLRVSEMAGLNYTDIRSALAYCHSRGIVHGDLKAENVLLREDGSAVLSDFGISRITDGRMRQSLELTGSCEAGGFGTAYALAPECRDGALATSASDIYSFGVLLFKVVTGIWYDGSERMLGNLKVFAPKWSALFGLMLQRDPARRPATAAELPDDPLGCRFGSVAHLRGRYGRYALVAASFAVCIIFLAIARTVGRRDLTPPNISWPQAVSRADALGVRDGVIAPYQDDVKLPAGRVSMSKTAHFNRLNLPADGIVSIEIPGDFSGTLLTADEVDGELREQVRVVPQPGMRVLYRGNREVVVKRQ